MRMTRRYTPEEISFVKKNVKGRSYAETLELFNKRFNLSLTKKQLETLTYKHKLHNGIGSCNGGSPPNKGKKFKIGPGNKRYRPIGSERLDNGYVVVKTSGSWVWERKHVLVWEARHGKVPKGHIVVFLDKNKMNITLNNLALVSRSVHQTMNHLKLYTTNREITKSNIAVCQIKSKISSLKRKSFTGVKNKKIVIQDRYGGKVYVIKNKGRFISVRETKNGGLKRLKTKKLKSRATRQQAQRELLEYAQYKGWQRI